ncbi:CsbD family protein [Peptostreptococcus equinus]|uniref:CsbD family protein n=1 Tax=Peptostreptococcus equinus TaxID=3003601 RepID=A0ABY7JQT6_9FIRM|nr:CsbD family protein [Peptostreptococcus sp. CBA3647]WAW14728.1 CsbD family protein [Peptostreptococcus sp. CBA3647]WAW15470.1 CsbD family protein [Peptostreptococcus sp. CBA3647]
MKDTGVFDKVKGSAKNIAGEATGDNKLKAEGAVDKATGKAKELLNEAGKKAEEVADNAKSEINKHK